MQRMITAGMYKFALSCMKRVFAALQLLQMVQQPNRYEGVGNCVKAHCPEPGDEPAKKCMKQAAKKKGPISAGRKGSKASSSLAQCTGCQSWQIKDTTDVGRTR